MRILKFMPAVMLYVLIGLPVVLAASEAYAACCMCYSGCPRGCTCPGTGGCASCAIDDFEAFQSTRLANDDTSGVPIVRTPTSIATNSRMLDQLMRLGQTGQCAVNNFALRLLADSQRLFRLDQMFSKAYVSQDNRVALRIINDH